MEGKAQGGARGTDFVDWLYGLKQHDWYFFIFPDFQQPFFHFQKSIQMYSYDKIQCLVSMVAVMFQVFWICFQNHKRNFYKLYSAVQIVRMRKQAQVIAVALRSECISTANTADSRSACKLNDFIVRKVRGA